MSSKKRYNSVNEALDDFKNVQERKREEEKRAKERETFWLETKKKEKELAEQKKRESEQALIMQDPLKDFLDVLQNDLETSEKWQQFVLDKMADQGSDDVCIGRDHITNYSGYMREHFKESQEASKMMSLKHLTLVERDITKGPLDKLTVRLSFETCLSILTVMRIDVGPKRSLSKRVGWHILYYISLFFGVFVFFYLFIKIVSKIFLS